MLNIDKSNKILLISNAIVTNSICHIINQYDYIVRFNSGSNPYILSSSEYKDLYGERVDLCVINGHHTGRWGDLSGFKDKHILFNYLINHKDNQYILHEFQKYTNNIKIIDNNIYNQFLQKYDYKQNRVPTTGLLTIYHLAENLGLEITCLNFFLDNQMKHFVLKKNTTFNVHDYESEIKIFNQINCKKIHYT